MSWRIDIANSANKFLARIPNKDCVRIKVALQRMVENPYDGDIGKLKGDLVWRRRIGSYRIFFEIYDSSRTVGFMVLNAAGPIPIDLFHNS